MQCIAGKYEIIDELGEGGSGTVYLVKHIDLGINYAVKLLSRNLSDNAHFIEKFKHEAAILQRFSHPGTTQLRDFGRTEDGLYYLAMDYCSGTSLKDVLDKEGPYHLKGALNIMKQLLVVLQAAHHEGIIHRDIKPGNLMIEQGPEAKESLKVLDFGTALLKEGLGLGDVLEEESVCVGTPCYMSPEQASGGALGDHLADIYAAGIVMYELLTGEVPFEGASVVQTLIMHLTLPPLAFAARYGLPKEAEDITFKALQKKPENRYQSAEEFCEACSQLIEKLLDDRTHVYEEPICKEVEEATQVLEDLSDSEVNERPVAKILCLDDDQMILNILEHVLKMEGYQVFSATDCSAIHGYLFQEHVDLLVCDVQMPGMPGTKVCKLLKKSLPELKVLLFSNIDVRDLEKYSIRNNADGWISKTTKPEEWLNIIRSSLEA